MTTLLTLLQYHVFMTIEIYVFIVSVFFFLILQYFSVNEKLSIAALH